MTILLKKGKVVVSTSSPQNCALHFVPSTGNVEVIEQITKKKVAFNLNTFKDFLLKRDDGKSGQLTHEELPTVKGYFVVSSLPVNQNIPTKQKVFEFNGNNIGASYLLN